MTAADVVAGPPMVWRRKIYMARTWQGSWAGRRLEICDLGEFSFEITAVRGRWTVVALDQGWNVAWRYDLRTKTAAKRWARRFAAARGWLQ